MRSCSIVIPCYNEAKRLRIESFKCFSNLNHAVRFLFVNDGSTDNTKEILETLCDFNPEKLSVHHIRHSGKAEAVRQGVLKSLKNNPDFVGFWDADLATPLGVILEFCELLERNHQLHMVFGARVKLLGRKIERRMVRHYPGRVFATMASVMLGLAIYDTQCGAKLFRCSDKLGVIFEQRFKTKWAFDVELIARLKQRNEITLETSIYEFPLIEWCDVKGSKVKPGDFAWALIELSQIFWTYLRPWKSP